MRYLFKISIIITLFQNFSCSNIRGYQTKCEFEEACNEACEELENKGIIKLIKLNEITNFSWDKVWVIDGPKEGFTNPDIGIRDTYLYIPDDNTRLIFLKDKKVITYFDVGTFNYNFIKSRGCHSFSKDNFYIARNKNSKYEVKYENKPKHSYFLQSVSKCNEEKKKCWL